MCFAENILKWFRNISKYFHCKTKINIAMGQLYTQRLFRFCFCFEIAQLGLKSPIFLLCLLSPGIIGVGHHALTSAYFL